MRVKITAPETARPAATTEPLHVKYRPRRLEDVVGQDAVVKSLRSALQSRARAHAYLFTGPAGTGKTTLARITAASLGCDPASVVEVDAASQSGIDDMRQLTAGLQYQGFGATPGKAIIVDECHGLSKNAWDSLLKITEEPPAHVFFFFCSTNPGKIPAAMLTRCLSYNLQAVKRNTILGLLDDVCGAEGLNPASATLDAIADACVGSPRAALTMLAKTYDCADIAEVRVLLEQPIDNAEVIDLCRLLIRGDLTWPKLTATLRALGDGVPAETVRIIVVNYLAACAMGAKSDKDAIRATDMIAEFGRPFNASDKMAPLLVCFARYMFG